MTFTYGDTVRIAAAFTDTNGDLANPTTVVFTVKAPDGSTTTPSNTNFATGRYRATTDGDQAGIWYYRVVGTGGGSDAADEGSFCVEESSI